MRGWRSLPGPHHDYNGQASFTNLQVVSRVCSRLQESCHVYDAGVVQPFCVGFLGVVELSCLAAVDYQRCCEVICVLECPELPLFYGIPGLVV